MLLLLLKLLMVVDEDILILILKMVAVYMHALQGRDAITEHKDETVS